MAIKTLIFDFGNVIGFFDRKVAARQLAGLADSGQEGRILEFLESDPDGFRYELGQVDCSWMINRLRNEFGIRGTDQTIRKAYSDMFAKNRAVCDLVPEFKKDKRLLLLSNTNPMHFEQLETCFQDTLSLFDALILSHQAGSRKPDKNIYELSLGKANAAPEECCLIDDLAENIRAAGKLGIRGIVYHPGIDLLQTLKNMA